ncbi:hypothetical protein RJ641_016646 [Dillenia turbinata]|uniref:Uncharacterized protein n=1 Tax=Dillenia turbinata TaxID=194707 RepID=A0AAN8YWZ3_9MAGN
MAPRNGRGKPKGEKKKKEEKALPVVVDITVNLPDDSRVVLKGISTDRIIDIRKLLSINTITCSITNFSLSHKVRGLGLKDSVEVAALKPCVLTLTEGAQDKGAGGEKSEKSQENVTKKTDPTNDLSSKDSPSVVDGEGEMSNSCPKLGCFYDFFSLSHLTPPLQFIRRAKKPQGDDTLADDHLFPIEAYDDLIKAFSERNKDASHASLKVDTKIDGIQATGLDRDKLVGRNLLKGITADENTAAHVAPERAKAGPSTPSLELEEVRASRAFVERLLEDSLAKLQSEEAGQDVFVRWELGACWIQHLQDQNNTEKDKKPSGEKAKGEMKVEGLGSNLKSLKNHKKKLDGSNRRMAFENAKSHNEGVSGEAEKVASAIESQLENNAHENELALKRILSDSAFKRLKETDTGLCCKSMPELIDMSQKYYNEVALPKLVGIELAPRDFDMDSLNPFWKMDIVSLVPVYKFWIAVCQYVLGTVLELVDYATEFNIYAIVSDLLDYINPSQDTKGRDTEAVRRKGSIAKSRGKSIPNYSIARSDASPKEASNEASDEEKQVSEFADSTEAVEEISSPPSVFEQPVQEETISKVQEFPNEIVSEKHMEGDEGWQPVQRPRSAGSYGRRLRQCRTAINKVCSYQKKEVADAEVDHARAKNTYPNGRYYFLKKKAISPGGHTDYHNAKSPSSVNKFGRRIVKAVAYRVKSMSSSNKDTASETNKNAQIGLASSGAQNELGQISQRSSIVSLGKSPSYKEVALAPPAPPGTISKFQVMVSQNDASDNKEVGDRKIAEKRKELKENAETGNIEEEHTKIVVVNIIDPMGDEVEAVEKKEISHSNVMVHDNPSEIVPECSVVSDDTSEMVMACREDVASGSIEVHKVTPESIAADAMSNTLDSPTVEPCEKDLFTSSEPKDSSNPTSQGIDDLKDKPLVINSGDTKEVQNKKLSALAAPFSPSPAIARAAPVPINIPLPPSPAAVAGVNPWPINMTLHPGPTPVMPTVSPMCSSPHHPFPSPPPTPNMIHSFPFMYPPYTQPQPVPPTNFPVTTAPFHHNHFAWQCNMNPNASEFVPRTVWPSCHPVEFSILPPVIEPIADTALAPKVQSDNSDSSSPVPNLPVDIHCEEETAKEMIASSPVVVDAEKVNGNPVEGVKENGNLNLIAAEKAENECRQMKFPIDDNASNGNTHGSKQPCKMDGERTFNILLRGRRNRRQTLRMPISLLSKPYGSQSFKVIYNRVVRGSEMPKSACFSSTEDAAPTAT